MIASRRPSPVGGPRKNKPCVSSFKKSASSATTIEENPARIDDERRATRLDRIVGDRVQARGERVVAFLRAHVDLRVELLELIDEQQQAAIVAARATAEHVAEVAGLARQRLDELLLLVHLVGEIDRGADHRRDHARASASGVACDQGE